MLTKADVQQTIDLAISNLATKEEIAKLATKEEIAKLATKEEIAKLATKEELYILGDKFSEIVHQIQITNEDTNRTVHLMYELLLPKSDKIDRIDPLADRVERCEEEIDVIKLAVTSHTTNKDIHRKAPSTHNRR